MSKEPKIVQVKNPRSGRYIRINRHTGQLWHKKSDGPYKNVPIVTEPLCSNDHVSTHGGRGCSMKDLNLEGLSLPKLRQAYYLLTGE